MAPATGRPPHTTDRGGYFAVVDPSTGEAFDEAPDRRPEELDPVVDRARAAWPGWRADPAARRTALLAAADAVEAAATALAPLLTREQGKPLTESHAEVARTAARLRYFAELDIGAQPITDDRPVHSRLRWRSIGAVAAIVPWNFPCNWHRRSSRRRWPRATRWCSSPHRPRPSPPGCWGPSWPVPCPRAY